MPVARTANLRVVHCGQEMRAIVSAARAAGDSIGFVPTMGALHEGHLSLVDAARRECDHVVASIFVNPTQFGPREDFSRYPRPLERDIEMLRERDCSWAFVPDAAEMYPSGFDTSIDVGAVAQPWEGVARPGHFRGVATVVYKLFQFMPADRAYFGQKDYQQTLVVKRMAADLGVPIEIRVMPTVRDSDGLAMSSRNAYLSPDERRQALAINQALRAAEASIAAGQRHAESVRGQIRDYIRCVGDFEVDYIAIVNDGTVEEVAHISGPVVLAVAARVGSTRLIDNIRVAPPEHT